MGKLLKLFYKCWNASYTHVENDGDFAIERKDDILYILFECTNSKIDWKNNFDFPAKPYSDMGIKWMCHRGFLRVWKSIKPYIKDVVADETVKKIYVVGYSHGAAIATLCYEYVWYNRPDLREDGLEGYGFGCPRVYWGVIKKELKKRWEHFYPIRNLNDIVTHAPPSWLGFRHVNQVYRLKNTKLKNKYKTLKCVSAHYPDNYIFSLKNEEEDNL